MSKFHKTLKNHFNVGDSYTIKRITDVEPIQTTYIGFEKGHLLFKAESLNVGKTYIPHIDDKAFAARHDAKDYLSVIGINGSDIRDSKVNIKNGSLMFTTNGWIEN